MGKLSPDVSDERANERLGCVICSVPRRFCTEKIWAFQSVLRLVLNSFDFQYWRFLYVQFYYIFYPHLFPIIIVIIYGLYNFMTRLGFSGTVRRIYIFSCCVIWENSSQGTKCRRNFSLDVFGSTFCGSSNNCTINLILYVTDRALDKSKK